MGASRGDGGLKIAGHSHGSNRKTVSIGNAYRLAKIWIGIGVCGWNAHDAAQQGAETLPAIPDKTISLGGCDSGFLRLVANIDLDQQIWTGPEGIRMPGQRIA